MNFQKSVKNMVWTVLCQIALLMLSFVSRSVFIHFLSVEYLGISGLFSNILTLLSFTELGIGNVMVFSLYEPLKQNDKERINSLLILYKKAYMGIALTILSIGTILLPFVPQLIREVPDIPENICFLYALYLLNTVVSYLATYKKSVLLADQKAYVVNIAVNISHAVLIVVQCAALYVTKSFTAYLICQIASTFLTNVVLTCIVNKQYRSILSNHASPLPEKERRKIFNNIKALAISKVSGVVSSGTDNIIISTMFGLRPVGLVANYTMLINSVNNVFYSALTSISSSIGNFNVDSDIEARNRVFSELFLAVFFLYSFVCTCLFVLVQPFVSLWIGNDYLVSLPVLFHLVLGIYVGGMNYPVYSFRTTKGYFKEVQFVYIACAMTNVGLSILFGKLMGVAGVFMATWVSKFVLTEVADSYYTYKKILEKKHTLYFIKYGCFFAVEVVNTICCWGLVAAIPFSGWVGFALKAGLCAFMNLLINTIVFCRTSAFKCLWMRVCSIVQKV